MATFSDSHDRAGSMISPAHVSDNKSQQSSEVWRTARWGQDRNWEGTSSSRVCRWLTPALLKLANPEEDYPDALKILIKIRRCFLITRSQMFSYFGFWGYFGFSKCGSEGLFLSFELTVLFVDWNCLWLMKSIE